MGCHSELPCECDQISSFNKWACLEWSLSVNGQMADLKSELQWTERFSSSEVKNEFNGCQRQST